MRDLGSNQLGKLKAARFEVKMSGRSSLWQAFLVHSLALLLCIFLFTLNLRLLSSQTFVLGEQKRVGVPRETEFSEKELRAVNEKLLKFINSGGRFPAVTVVRSGKEIRVFEQREIDHLYDIQSVFEGSFWARWISLLLSLLIGATLVAARRGLDPKAIYRYSSRVGFLFVSALGVLCIFVLLAFNLFFTGFHQLFFAPGTWIFGTGEMLPQFFPERFWLESAVLLIAGTMIEIGLALLVCRVPASPARAGS